MFSLDKMSKIPSIKRVSLSSFNEFKLKGKKAPAGAVLLAGEAAWFCGGVCVLRVVARRLISLSASAACCFLKLKSLCELAKKITPNQMFNIPLSFKRGSISMILRSFTAVSTFSRLGGLRCGLSAKSS